MKEVFNKYLNDEIKVDKLRMIGILSLIIVIAGVFGFIYEFIFYYFNGGMKVFYYRGSNFLPWINIYATGSLIIYFFTRKYKKSPLKVFLISFISTGILEFISGWVIYTFFHFRCWDYNTEILNFLNIGGYVCLRSVLFFGISGLLLIYMIIPICYYLAIKLNRKLFIILSIGICSIFMFDELYNLIFARLLHLKRASDIYKQIGFKYVNFK